MNPKYIYNTSDIGYMDEEWKDYTLEDDNKENETIIDDEEQVKEI